MKILDSSKKNFDKNLESLLFERKNRIRSTSAPVLNIIKQVKKNGDKAV